MRVGFIATNSIRGGVNKKAIEHFEQVGRLFYAWSDREWVLNGADVRTSILGFDSGEEPAVLLNGEEVETINSDLTKGINVGLAVQLTENEAIQFEGTKKGAHFHLSSDEAVQILRAPLNPNGRPNSDVVVPWVNGSDIVRRPRGMWVVDFGADMSIEEAALYEEPFRLVEERVKPKYEKKRRQWWLHERARSEMRNKLGPLSRFVNTARVSKHRIFVWQLRPTLPDSATIAFARDDDYFFGVLHSIAHESWTLKTCTWLGVGNDPRYTPTTTFETFPFPWPPGEEPTDSPLVHAIAEAAKDLVEKRNRWLNPDGATEAELKKRTLTNLYNDRPTWLDLAHKKLDGAVFDAYGWPHDLTEDEILERLLALNLERAGAG